MIDMVVKLADPLSQLLTNNISTSISNENDNIISGKKKKIIPY